MNTNSKFKKVSDLELVFFIIKYFRKSIKNNEDILIIGYDFTIQERVLMVNRISNSIYNNTNDKFI
jgi:hypothetical protein